MATDIREALALAKEILDRDTFREAGEEVIRNQSPRTRFELTFADHSVPRYVARMHVSGGATIYASGPTPEALKKEMHRVFQARVIDKEQRRKERNARKEKEASALGSTPGRQDSVRATRREKGRQPGTAVQTHP